MSAFTGEDMVPPGVEGCVTRRYARPRQTRRRTTPADPTDLRPGSPARRAGASPARRLAEDSAPGTAPAGSAPGTSTGELEPPPPVASPVVPDRPPATAAHRHRAVRSRPNTPRPEVAGPRTRPARPAAQTSGRLPGRTGPDRRGTDPPPRPGPPRSGPDRRFPAFAQHRPESRLDGPRPRPVPTASRRTAAPAAGRARRPHFPGPQPGPP